MRALVWEGPRSVAVRVKPVPRPAAGEVLIRSKAVGLCGSDVHIYEGHFAPAVPPLTLGHESAGVVEEACGDSRIHAGQRVVVSPNVGCDACHFCRRGSPHQCLQRRIIGMAGWDGGLADYFVAPVRNVFPMPDAVTWEDGASMDSLACALHGVSKLPIPLGESVAVFGAGPSGLCFIQLCRLRGASQIIAVDPNEWRLREAARYGADHIVNPAREDPVAAVRAFTQGLGADTVVESSGALAAVPACVRAARSCGKVLTYGIYSAPVDGVDFQDQHRREITIYGSTGAPDSYAASVELVASGRVRLGSMVTHRVALEDAPRFFADGVIRDAKDGCLKAIVMLEAA